MSTLRIVPDPYEPGSTLLLDGCMPTVTVPWRDIDSRPGPIQRAWDAAEACRG